MHHSYWGWNMKGMGSIPIDFNRNICSEGKCNLDQSQRILEENHCCTPLMYGDWVVWYELRSCLLTVTGEVMHGKKSPQYGQLTAYSFFSRSTFYITPQILKCYDTDVDIYQYSHVFDNSFYHRWIAKNINYFAKFNPFHLFSVPPLIKLCH